MVLREYTVVAALAAALTVAVELRWLRTGVFRTVSYWVALAVVFVFQTIVDGWLTRLPRPMQRYQQHEITGWRFPLDIPVENFACGFALVTLTIVLWVRQDQRARTDADGAEQH